MKYIYIVTRIVTGHKVGTPVPNLGVWTNFKAAKHHYDGIVEDRQKRGCKVLWNHYLPSNDEFERRVVEALLAQDDEREHLFIEKWPMGRA
jgi:hypothetical protein